MRRTQQILSDYQIEDVEQVKEYITNSFLKRKPKKSDKLYINLCNIYEYYPYLVEEIINNIPKLGYCKDYFHILSFSNNYALNNYIYNVVIKQITLDLDNLQKGIPISTLGKWLPSEGSRINRKINFVDKFNALVWGKTQLSKFTLRKKYRQLKTRLNKELGTLETLMATRQLDNIDIKKVSNYSLQRHKHHLLKNPEMINKYNDYEKHRLMKLNLFDFVKELDTGKCDNEILKDIWDTQNYHMLIPYVNQIINNSVCVVDLSQDMFTNNAHYLSLGIALLVSKMSDCQNNVIVGKDIVKFDNDMSLVDMKNKLLKYSGPLQNINVEYYKKLVNSDKDYVMIFITNKQIIYPKIGTFIQVTPYFDNNYDIMMINNNKCNTVSKYECHDTTRERVKNIISERSELCDTTYIFYIFGIVCLWMMLKIMEVFFGPRNFIMGNML
jgi:hypothetical protein